MEKIVQCAELLHHNDASTNRHLVDLSTRSNLVNLASSGSQKIHSWLRLGTNEAVIDTALNIFESAIERLSGQAVSIQNCILQHGKLLMIVSNGTRHDKLDIGANALCIHGHSCYASTSTISRSICMIVDT
jgi:hypothetical protein